MPSRITDGLLAKCSCSSCGTHLQFAVENAGATIRCPNCNADTELTLSLPEPSPNQLSPGDLMAGFTGTFPRTRASRLYQLGLVLVSAAMICLPLVYLALIAAVAFGTYHYAIQVQALLGSFRGGIYVYLLKVMLYLGPLLAGASLVLFMVKPLFAKRARRAQPLAMNPALEPALYSFIARICDLTGAPMPKRIDLDCQLNASAGFRRGYRSLFSDDLVLCIGLPVVAGLNLREFAGVMAHEFGHFTQGFGMRLSYIVRQINFWFARLVYERDAWDVWLEEQSMEGEDWWLMLVCNCVRFAVGISRLILKALMFLGHGISCFLLREMEYDADTYEVKLAGSAAFESSVRKMALLSAASTVAYKEMRTSWNLNHMLPENVPAFIALHASKLPRHVKETIRHTLGLAKTRLFDTHPSTGDRLRRARQAAEPGVFHLDKPASTLFSHFDVVSRQVTQLHYTDDLGLSMMAAKLRPVSPPAPGSS